MQQSLSLIPLVVSLFHIDRCIDSNSEPEKCYPTKRTIGSLLSWPKLNDIIEVHQIIDFFYKLKPPYISARRPYFISLCQNNFGLLAELSVCNFIHRLACIIIPCIQLTDFLTNLLKLLFAFDASYCIEV